MIIFIYGPPASGKSTMIANFVMKHPDWQWLSIDQFRNEHLNVTYNTENIAWEKLKDAIYQHSKVIIETGKNWRASVLYNDLIQDFVDVAVIKVDAFPAILHKRLQERHKSFSPKHYKMQDEHDAVDFFYSYRHESKFHIESTWDFSNLNVEESCEQFEFIIKQEIYRLKERKKEYESNQ